MNDHPTVLLHCCDGDPHDIDEAMVPLITALWKREVHTCNGCCQGEAGGRAYISFPDIGDADRFATLVMRGGAAPVLVAGMTWGMEKLISPAQLEAERARGYGVGADGLPWTWRIYVRFPMWARATIRVDFAHDDIDRIAEWVNAAPSTALDDALPSVPVHAKAGRPAKRRTRASG